MKKTYSELIKIAQKYLSKNDITLIKKAFKFADTAHRGQFRKNKDPYIEHPLQIALTLANMGLDANTISAALLHDTLEDTNTNQKQIEKEFGQEIADLVIGITRLSKVRLKRGIITSEELNEREKIQIEDLRKMFVAMAKDVRVILIKLADRLHNMETLYALPESKAKRIALETIEIYAPLAHRLGIGEIKGQLEDLAFAYTNPKEYRWVKGLVGEKYQEKNIYIAKVIKFLKKDFKKENIGILEINGRLKHLYSLYKKLLKHDSDITKIYDFVAIRIITYNISDCYKILGIIHKFWKPLKGYIKDYISVPKPNGYQSLHTTIFAFEGKICEIQIRTPEMNEHAEYGVAAHWHYSTKIGPKKELEIKGIFAPKKELKWISELAKWQNKLKNSRDFKKALKLDFFSDRIFVFTPKGDVKNLPLSATPIDFAYSIHSDIGDHCFGAKVNNKLETLNYQLQNGDIVEIITAKNSRPGPDWLKSIKTAEARSKIKKYLKDKKLI